MLQLQLLGSPQIILNGAVVRDLTSLKSQALLFYLAMKGRAYSRLSLGGLLWPEKDDSGARTNLRQAVRQLRVALGDYIVATREAVSVSPELPLKVDVWEFTDLAASGETEKLQQAADLYTGDFLAGFFVDDLLDYENWILLERERLRRVALQTLQQLSMRYAEGGEGAAAIRATTRLLALEPWHEESYRQMMRLLASDGQVSAALAQYETCRQVLAAELGAEPAAATTALYEAIRQSRQRQGAAESQSLPAPAHRSIPHNLPRQFTDFVGRDDKLRQIKEWLQQPSCALITLHGPGGIGKTRLAVEAATSCLADFPDGAWFVDLASIERPESLFSAVAAGLGLNPSGASDVRMQVLQHLQQRRLLLILDNFEHLLTGAGTLLQLLQQAREVQVLVTSRVSLGLQAEWLLPVDGLALIEDGGDREDGPAITLFRARMEQIRPGQALTAKDRRAISWICRQVAGMPLAIELAAALTRTCTVSEIAAALQEDNDILATTQPDVPARQRSLRAVFNYSWELLTPQEQQAVAALAVFAGSFSAVAAYAVAATNDAMLLTLLDKSLLHQPIPGRYEMHELLRRHAMAKLETLPPPAGDELQQRHSHFYLDFVREREDALWQPGAELALAEIQREWANISKAWQSAVQARALPLLEASETGLYHFHGRSGQLSEGEAFFGGPVRELESDLPELAAGEGLRRLLGRLLGRQARFLAAQAKYEEAVPVVDRALLFAGAVDDSLGMANANLVRANVLSLQGDLEGAQERLEQALAQAERAGAPKLVGAALSSIGVLHFHRGDQETAAAYIERARRAYEETGDYGGKAGVENNLASIAVRRGDYDGARQAYERALRAYREIGEYGGEALVLGNLGIVASHMNRFDEATARVQQALAMSQAAHMRRLVCALLNTLGVVQLHQGDLAAAAASLAQSLEIARAIGNRYTESEALSNRSLLALYQGSTDEALQLAQDAVQAAQSAGERTLLGFAWMALGRAQEGLGRYSSALKSYDTALGLRQAAGHEGLLLETRAAVARVAHCLGQERQAQETAGAVWSALGANENKEGEPLLLHGMEEPGRLLLTCYQLFREAGDVRAAAVLDCAGAVVEKWASFIPDSSLRHSFLEDIPAHRELQQLLGQRQPTSV